MKRILQKHVQIPAMHFAINKDKLSFEIISFEARLFTKQIPHMKYHCNLYLGDYPAFRNITNE